MAEVEVTINGVLYDKQWRTARPVVLVGSAYLTNVGVGGGPIIPPDQLPPDQGGPPPRPSFPIALPPDTGWLPGGPSAPGGYPDYIWSKPILPPQVPPGMQPPVPPKPGDPTAPVPPPAGSAGWPVNPIVIPDYIVVWYPGVGPVFVAPPQTAATTPPAKK